MITIVAYIVKVVGRIFCQTFGELPYDWKAVLIINKK
jgi:hypothetical protein